MSSTAAGCGIIANAMTDMTPHEPVPEGEVAALYAFEQAFDPARPTARPAGSEMVGFGEISMVFKLDRYPDRVFKRVAGLRPTELIPYRQVVDAYVARLESCGVAVASVEAFEVEREAGRPILYLAQRAIDPALLAHRQVAEASDAELERLLETILGHIDAVIPRGGIGLDAQLSNWALDAPGAFDRLTYLDLTTPMLRDGERERLDLSFALRALPLPMRALMQATRAEQKMMGRYYHRRSVALDVVSNLVKEGQAHRLPLAIDVVNRWLGRIGARPLSLRGVRADYRADARLWAFLQWVKRPDRWVRTRLLRRPYDWVLAPAIDRKAP